MTDTVENQENNTPAEPTANEVEARSAGWVPKEEYHGDENKWVDADEFVRRGPLFEKINVQSRELKEVKKALDALKAHHATVKETAYKEALAELKKQKKDAFIDGDADKILEIEEKTEALKEEQRQFSESRTAEITKEVQAEVHPEFQAWTNRNPWYTTDRPMKAFADALGVELRATGMSPSEVLKKVEIKIKEEFPQKFRNPNRDKAGAVEGSGKGTGKSHNDGSDTLTDLERNVMNRFVRMGVMTKEQYISDLKKTKETK
jgi:hypothetical protein